MAFGSQPGLSYDLGLHSFYSDPWEFGWEALVAVATFALAAVTVVLAWRTSKMASKTADLAEFTKQDVALSRTAIEADVRPVLITVPRGEFVHPMGQNYEVHVPGTGERRGHPDRSVVYVQMLAGGSLCPCLHATQEPESRLSANRPLSGMALN